VDDALPTNYDGSCSIVMLPGINGFETLAALFDAKGAGLRS